MSMKESDWRPTGLDPITAASLIKTELKEVRSKFIALSPADKHRVWFTLRDIVDVLQAYEYPNDPYIDQFTTPKEFIDLTGEAIVIPSFFGVTTKFFRQPERSVPDREKALDFLRRISVVYRYESCPDFVKVYIDPPKTLFVRAELKKIFRPSAASTILKDGPIQSHQQEVWFRHESLLQKKGSLSRALLFDKERRRHGLKSRGRVRDIRSGAAVSKPKTSQSEATKALDWPDIEIKVPYDTEIVWRRKGTSNWRILTRSQLKLTKGHDKPTELWMMLLELAKNGGWLKWGSYSLSQREKLKKRKDRLDKKLQDGFVPPIHKPLLQWMRELKDFKMRVHSILDDRPTAPLPSQDEVDNAIPPEKFKVGHNEMGGFGASAHAPISTFKAIASKFKKRE